MHVALLGNTAWLDEELTMFGRMVVGLMDEQVRVAQVLPDVLPETDVSAVGARIAWRDTSWSPLRTWRLTRLAPLLRSQGIDLIHAVDGRLWRAALRLAERLDLSAVLTANSYLDIPLAGALHPHVNADRTVFMGSSAPLAKAIKERVGSTVTVQTVLPGVHLDVTPRSAPEPGQPLCAIVAGSGLFDEHYEALFAAIVEVTRVHPQAQFFLDGQGHDQHLLWRQARRAGILANISLVPRRLGHREVLLRGDVLIQPQALGRSRGLTLQCMARGIPVLARPDPWLDYLNDQTAWLVDRPEAARWTQLIQQLIEQPADATKLAAGARVWVQRHHVPATQIAQTLSVYRRLAGEPIRLFAGA